MAANRTYPLRIKLDGANEFVGFQEMSKADMIYLRYLIRKEFASRTNQAGWLALNNDIGTNIGAFTDTRLAASSSASPRPSGRGDPTGTNTIDKSIITDTTYTVYENTSQPSEPTLTDTFASVFDHESKYKNGYFEPNANESEMITAILKDTVREIFFSSSNGSAGDPNNDSNLNYDGIGSFVIQTGNPASGSGVWSDLGQITDIVNSSGTNDETINLWVKVDDAVPTVSDLPITINTSGPSMRPMEVAEVVSQFTTYLQRYLTSNGQVYRFTDDTSFRTNEVETGSGDFTIEDSVSSVNTVNQGGGYFHETIGGNVDANGNGPYRLLRTNTLAV